MEIEKIAEVAHECTRLYCEAIGDTSRPPWNVADDQQKKIAIEGVKYLKNHHNAPPGFQHAQLLKIYEEDKWKHGAVLDVEKKISPYMVPFADLPDNVRMAEALFAKMVNVLTCGV